MPLCDIARGPRGPWVRVIRPVGRRGHADLSPLAQASMIVWGTVSHHTDARPVSGSPDPTNRTVHVEQVVFNDLQRKYLWQAVLELAQAVSREAG